MIVRLCTTLFVLAVTGLPLDLRPDPGAPIAHRVTPVEEKVLKAIEAWLKEWRSKKIDMTLKVDITRLSIASKMGLLPKGMIGTLTYQRELDVMLEQAVALDTAEAAEAILEVASAGLDGLKYDRLQAPHLVREVGEKWIGRLKSAAAKDFVLKAARGEAKVDRTRMAAITAAALRGLGALADPVFRAPLEQALGSTQMQARLGAAEGLQRLGNEASVEALARALEREDTENVVLALVSAIRRSYERYARQQAPGSKDADKGKDSKDGNEGKDAKDAAKDGKDAKEGNDGKDTKDAKDAKEPPAVTELPESSRGAVRSAIKALGRTGWRADMELVSFLDDFRSAETIPALIDVLQRFKTRPEDIPTGKLSTLLLHRAHETLVGMTGAVIPADQPEKWRELWQKEQGKIQIAPKKSAVAHQGGTVSTLFGIPIQGSRITIVIDLSGSMDFPMRSRGSDGQDKVQSRLDVARRELLKMIDGMPEVTMFNYVTFHGAGANKPEGWADDAQVWKKEGLVPANAKNKEEFRKAVTNMKADGGTNLWAGLQEALKIKSWVYGQRYETNLDELFIISDGAPTVGEVTDAAEILRIVTETNKFAKMRINTVFITSPNERNPRDQTLAPDELMKRLAEQNGGKFVKFSD